MYENGNGCCGASHSEVQQRRGTGKLQGYSSPAAVAVAASWSLAPCERRSLDSAVRASLTASSSFGLQHEYIRGTVRRAVR